MTIRRFNLEDVGGYCHAVIDSPEGELMYARDVLPVINQLKAEIIRLEARELEVLRTLEEVVERHAAEEK